MIKVWIDHAQAPSNLDVDIMYGKGAIKESDVYHADVSFAGGGIEYVWKGRVTSVIAQNVRRNLGGIFNYAHPISSFTTILKEYIKGFVGRKYSNKYQMHFNNTTMRPTQLEDGTPIIEFMRSNPSWAGVSEFEKGKDVGKVMTEKMLGHLIKKEGSSILYTHLGKINSLDMPFDTEAMKAFELLSDKYQAGDLLVLTTRRQLDYLKNRDSLEFRTETKEGRAKIVIESRTAQIRDLEGMTWYVPDSDLIDIVVNGELVNDVVRITEDHTGKPCVMIPLKPLIFPEI